MKLVSIVFAAGVMASSAAFSAALSLPENKRFCAEDRAATCLEATDPTHEYGEVGGMRYALYSDGSGVAEGMPQAGVEKFIEGNVWRIRCNRDLMSDRRTCSAKFRNLWIEASSRGSVLVSVGDNHFPGITSSLRVGQVRFNTLNRDGYFSVRDSSTIIGLMGKGAGTSTRFMKWPYRSWVEDEIEPYGVPHLVRLLRWLSASGR